MEGINEAIELLKQHGIMTERKLSSYSFGTKEECEQLFYETFKRVDTTYPNMLRLPEYDEVIDWMTDSKGKGLLLVGTNGRGKTTILMSVIPVIFSVRFNKIVHPFAATDIERIWKAPQRQWALAIDDLGTEARYNDYGEKKELFNDLINDAETFLKPTFISTNLDGQKIVDRYGIRAFDRIVRLCRIVKFSGDSLRK